MQPRSDSAVPELCAQPPHGISVRQSCTPEAANGTASLSLIVSYSGPHDSDHDPRRGIPQQPTLQNRGVGQNREPAWRGRPGSGGGGFHKIACRDDAPGTMGGSPSSGPTGSTVTAARTLPRCRCPPSRPGGRSTSRATSPARRSPRSGTDSRRGRPAESTST